MTAKKTLILHVGMGKTGTTAIQKSFWTNRDALARAGIAYPTIGATSGAHHLVSPHILPHLSARAPWRRFLEPAEWVPEVANLPEPRVFMSSELISSAEPARVAAFCAAVTPWVDLHVCIYLRRQDDMIAATYAQAVRGGLQRRPLGELIDSRLAHFDYEDRLAPWEAALGRDRLIVLAYERGQFHQGDLIRDVLFRVLGLPDLPPGFVHDPAATPNASLTVAATEFKRLVNALIPDRLRSGHYVTPLSACPADPKGTHLIGRADRARIIAHYADSNARVAQRYMGRPEGDLFREPLSPNAPATAPETGPGELRAVAAVLGQKAPGLLFDLADLVAADHSGDPAAAEAAATLAAAFDGLAMPRKPLGRKLRDTLRRLRHAATRPATPAARPAETSEPAPDTPDTVEADALPPPGGQEILVHFGIRKTGSSSIQETLFSNAGKLGATRYLSWGMANSSLIIRDCFVTPDGPPRIPPEVARVRFGRGLRHAASAPRAILSAETICDLDDAGMTALIAALTAQGARLRFIGYLRDPVSHTRSAMQERLKMRYFAGLPFLPGANLRKDYHLVVDRLDRLAGRDNVLVFPFDRALFPQGDVVLHFLDQAGIEPDGLTLHRVNESLSMTAVKALYAYRRLRVPRDTDIRSDATRETFIAALATLGGPAFQLSPEIDARIAAANTHILDWSEARLGRRLALPAPAGPDAGGIGSEADMLRFSAEDLDRLEALARAEGLPGLPAGMQGEEAAAGVAGLVHALRLKVVARAADRAAEKAAGRAAGKAA